MMKTESLRNFWNALPDHAGFNHFFDCPLSEVDNAAREIEKLKAQLSLAKQNHKEALKRLTKRVRSAAEKEWSTEQIAQAQLESGAL